MIDRRVAVAVLSLGVAGSSLAAPPSSPRITSVRPLRLGSSSSAGAVSSWASDGAKLYYVGWNRGESRLLQVAIAGGEPSEIETPPEFRSGFEIEGFLASQSALVCLVQAGRRGSWPVWLVPVSPGAPRRLGTLTANAAATSPDGQRIVLADQTGLSIGSGDGSGFRELTATPASASNLSWAPDGRHLRFVARARDQAEPWIWETTTTGAVPRPLWPGLDGGWTSDGRFFITQHWNELGRRADLFVSRESWLPLSRSEPAPLTTGPVEFSRPASRPDGRGLFALGVNRRGELLRYDVARKAFTPYLEGTSVLQLDVSPDGKSVVWTSWPDGALWRASADGSQQVQLTPAGLVAELPRWSPDGKWIAFDGQVAGGRRSVSVEGAPFVGLDATDAPLVVRDASRTDLYALDWDVQ